MAGPLNGVRIIDMTSVMMGPYLTQILGDLGADIIKVESPAGDTTRMVPPFRNPGMGCIFLQGNRNKRSIVIDLKKTEGPGILLELLKTADVFVSNVRPRALARLGLTPEAMADVNPGLIIMALVGFGQRGPYAADPAYDDLIQGLTAVPNLLVAAGSEKPHYVPLAFNDRSVGLHAGISLVSALLHREKTGEGQSIEVPMFETMVEYVLGDHVGGLVFEPPEGPPGYLRSLNKNRRPYETRDGYVCVIIYTDKHWRNFGKLIGRPHLLEEDAKFHNLTSRTTHAEEVYAITGEYMKEKTTSEWIALLKEADIPVTPLHTLESILEDPHLAATGYFKVMDHPSEGQIRTTSVPSTWSKSKPAEPLPAPRFGQHTVEILREARFTSEQIEQFKASGAVLVDG